MKGSMPLPVVLSILLLRVPAAVPAPGYLSPVHPKYATARKVFDDLVRAIGDDRTRPDLRLLPQRETGRSRGVWFAPDQNLVTLEEQAYDLCVSLEADSLHALAFLLGHELAHCYKDHGWVHDFGSAFSDLVRDADRAAPHSPPAAGSRPDAGAADSVAGVGNWLRRLYRPIRTR